jgi:hypothetical protein
MGKTRYVGNTDDNVCKLGSVSFVSNFLMFNFWSKRVAVLTRFDRTLWLYENVNRIHTIIVDNILICFDL